MTEQVVTLRIDAENGRLVAVTRESRVELDGLGKAAEKSGQQAERGARGVDRMGTSAERTRRQANGLSQTLGQLKALFAGYIGVQTLRDLARTADTYSDINGKLQQVTRSERELASAKAATFRISQQYYQELDATVTLYSRGAQALQQYGYGQAKVAQLTETINAGLLVSRASAAESSSAILKLSQALGAGALRGEEFNAVNEAAPRLMKALADSIGVPRGQLKGLAEDGKLTVDVLLKAWTGPEAQKIAEEASKVPLTISRAWQQLRNEVLRYVGEADQSAGTSAQIARAVQAIAQNLPAIMSGLATAARITAAYYLTVKVLPGAWNLATTAVVRHSAALTAMNLKFTSGFAASTAATIKQLKSVRAWASLALAAFAGWEIGNWMREEFLVVEQAGIALAGGLTKSATVIKHSFIITWGAIKAGALTMMNDVLERFATFAEKLAGYQEKIPLIGDRLAAATRSVAESARAARVETETAGEAFARLSAAAEKELADIDDAYYDLFVAAEKQREAADQGADAADNQALALGKLADASGDAAEKMQELLRAQQEFARENDRMEAQLKGPRALAEFEYADGVRQANEALAAQRATLVEVERHERMLRQTKQETLAELDREADVIGQLQRSYEEQIYLSELSVRDRRIEEQVIRAIAAAEEEANRQKQESIRLTPQQVSELRAYLRWSEDLIELNESQQQAANDFQRSWVNAIDSVSAAFGDWVTGGIKKFSDFGKTLKDIARRFLSDLIAQFTRNSLATVFGNWMRQVSSGGFAQAGGQGGALGWFGQLFGGGQSAAGGGLWGSVKQVFGFGGSPYAADGSYGKGYGVLLPQYGGGGQVAGGGLAYGGSAAGGSQGYTQIGSALAQGFVKYAPQILQYGSAIAPYAAGAAGLAGLYYGATQRGNGGLSSAAAGLSYGALGYSAATVGIGAVLGGAGAAAGAGAGAAAGGALAGASGAAAAIPVVGWVLAAMALVDMVSGGKLFGTKFKLDSSAVDLNFGPDGASGQQTVTQVRQRSLFRGRKWRTRTNPLSNEAQAALDDVFEKLNSSIEEAARQIGVAAPDMVVATFRQEFDKKGKLKAEFGTINGRRYNEDQETFFERLGLENLLQVAKAVGSGNEIEALANRYRGSVETLGNFTTLMLAMQGDVQNAVALWPQGQGMLTQTVELIERMARGGESLAETYQRLNQGARAYGNMIAGVEQQLLTADLNQYQRAQLEIELQYRDQVKQANELAKALGLSGARAEDLAKIEQLRALNMANLQKQMKAERDTFVDDLGLSGYSTLRDDQKLNNAMQLLQEAATGGDLQRARQLSETVLGLGRNLYASGTDYATLYNQVTGILNGIGGDDLDGFGESELREIADLLTDLPTGIAAAMWALMQGNATVTAPVPPPVTTPATPGGGSGTIPDTVSPGGGGMLDPDSPWRHIMARLDMIAANTGTSAQASASAALRELNSRGAAR